MATSPFGNNAAETMISGLRKMLEESRLDNEALRNQVRARDYAIGEVCKNYVDFDLQKEIYAHVGDFLDAIAAKKFAEALLRDDNDAQAPRRS
jgi:hypothetical protein